MKRNEDLEEIEEIYTYDQDDKLSIKAKLLIALGVVVLTALACVLVWLSIPTYEEEVYDVFVDYDDDEDVYDAFNRDIGHVYVSPDRVQLRFGDLTPSAELVKVTESRRITKTKKVTYTLYLYMRR